MNAMPVVIRELRTEARQPLNYWLRILGAAVMLITSAMVVINLHGDIAGKGGSMFGVLQPTLFSLIWLLAPIMTCDCISRERREGTLGLLFLTPLRPADVGVAKALSGALRAFTLLLAVLPVVAIPLLLGGVSGPDLLRAALMDLTALIAAMAAGLMASARCREFSRAALLGLLLSALFLILLGEIPVVYLLRQIFMGAWGGPRGLATWEISLFVLIGPWVIGSGIEDTWQRSPWATTPVYLNLSVGQVFTALGLLLIVLLLLNRRLRKLSVETGLTPRQLWWWKTFCTPRLFPVLLRRANRALLNRNPVGWLQRRTWSARLATWGWLGALVAVETFLITLEVGSGMNWNNLMDAQPYVAAFLGLGVAFSAADSFRRERETGALELLLVTPLTVSRVIGGRLFGLWGQYAPALALALATWWFTASWQPFYFESDLPDVRRGFALLYVSSFVCLPVIGLHQSLHQRHFLTAWLVTVALGFGIPLLVPLLAIVGWEYFVPTPFHGSIFSEYALVVSGFQLLFAGRAARSVHRNLSERRFAMMK